MVFSKGSSEKWKAILSKTALLTLIYCVSFTINSCNKDITNECQDLFIQIDTYQWNEIQESLRIDCSTNFSKGTMIDIYIRQSGRIDQKPFLKKEKIQHQIENNVFDIHLQFPRILNEGVNVYIIEFRVSPYQSDRIQEKWLKEKLIHKNATGQLKFTDSSKDAYYHFYEITTPNLLNIGQYYYQNELVFKQAKIHWGNSDKLMKAPIDLSLFKWRLTSRLDSLFSYYDGFMEQ